jgi:hypothetical protein
MLFTDPPISISILGRGQVKPRESGAASGELCSSPLIRFLVNALSLATKHSADGSIHFIFMGWRRLREMLAVGDEVYGGLKNLIVWVKTTADQGAPYRSQHELILVFENNLQ